MITEPIRLHRPREPQVRTPLGRFNLAQVERGLLAAREVVRDSWLKLCHLEARTDLHRRGNAITQARNRLMADRRTLTAFRRWRRKLRPKARAWARENKRIDLIIRERYLAARGKL